MYELASAAIDSTAGQNAQRALEKLWCEIWGPGNHSDSMFGKVYPFTFQDNPDVEALYPPEFDNFMFLVDPYTGVMFHTTGIDSVFGNIYDSNPIRYFTPPVGHSFPTPKTEAMLTEMPGWLQEKVELQQRLEKQYMPCHH